MRSKPPTDFLQCVAPTGAFPALARVKSSKNIVAHAGALPKASQRQKLDKKNMQTQARVCSSHSEAIFICEMERYIFPLFYVTLGDA